MPSVTSIFTRRNLGLLAAPVLLATLGACATPFKADVSRFASQLPAPQGQSFAVTSDDPALAGGLEFSQYAALVSGQMAKLGYVQAASPETADLVVKLDYDVDKGREKLRSTGIGYADPFYPWRGSWGGFYGRRGGFYGRRAFAYGWHDPFFFGHHGFNDVESITVYTSELDMKIDRRVDGSRLFEGKAQALSSSNRLPYLVPNLVEAMFTDFPGNSGETLRISIAPEKRTVRRVD